MVITGRKKERKKRKQEGKGETERERGCKGREGGREREGRSAGSEVAVLPELEAVTSTGH